MDEANLHFVISAPRSGSTWLVNALNQHPEVFATEHRLFGNFCQMWPNNNGRTAPRLTFDSFAQAFSVHYQHAETAATRGAFCDDFIQHYIQFLFDYAQKKTGCRIVVDKITPYPGTAKKVIQQIRKFVPKAKLIKLVRDGRDVLTSGAFDWLLKDGHGTDRFRFFVERQPGLRLKRFFDDAVITKWADLWSETNVALQKVNLAHTLRYESMAADFPASLQRVFGVLDVDSNAEISAGAAERVAFEKTTGRAIGTMDATAKQRKGIVGDWLNYMTREDAELFWKIAGDQLIREGYEENDRWIGNLDEHLDYHLKPAADGVNKF